MQTLARLSLAAVAVAFGEVMLGSWTRINGAGMTCPDYPLCHGEFIPSMGGGTVWEWTHRLTAALLSALVIGVLAVAWRERKNATFVLPAASVIGALFAFQVFLGAATVHLSNSPISVVWHWGTAMAFVASLSVMSVFAFAYGKPARGSSLHSGSAAGVFAGTALVAFCTMCIGAYVSSSGAGLACTQIPECAAHVVVYTPGQFVQMLHRFLAAACLLGGALSFGLAWTAVRSRGARTAATIGLALLFVQVLLGLLNVALKLPIDLREAHAANAALVFLSFVTATCLQLIASSRAAVPAAVPARD